MSIKKFCLPSGDRRLEPSNHNEGRTRSSRKEKDPTQETGRVPWSGNARTVRWQKPSTIAQNRTTQLLHSLQQLQVWECYLGFPKGHRIEGCLQELFHLRFSFCSGIWELYKHWWLGLWLRNRKVHEEEGLGGSDGDLREELRKAATLEQAGTLKPNAANRALAIVLTAAPF